MNLNLPLPPKKKISWCIVTFNRLETVKQALWHNYFSAGFTSDEFEIIWCDNASIDGTAEWVQDLSNVDVFIKNRHNMGADPGYNRCFQLARGEYIVVTGCDCKMPFNWMRTFYEYHEAIPNTGVSSMFLCKSEDMAERRLGPDITINGKTVFPALPIGRKFFRRELLYKFGYMREDMGLYGWADVLWARTAVRICEETGLVCYNIPDSTPEHLSTNGPIGPFKNEEEYRAWKSREAKDPQKIKLIGECAEKQWPAYWP